MELVGFFLVVIGLMIAVVATGDRIMERRERAALRTDRRSEAWDRVRALDVGARGRY